MARRLEYWRAQRQLEGLVEDVEVGTTATLQPVVRISVENDYQRYLAEGAVKDLERVEYL